MSFSERFIKAFQSFLPSPFNIAILLTISTILLALIGTNISDENPKIEKLSSGLYKLIAPKGKGYQWFPSGEKTQSIIIDPNKDDWCSVLVTERKSNFVRKFNFGLNNQIGESIIVEGSPSKIYQILNFWKDGLWKNGLLVFAFQMMLMLVLGHTLALSKPISYVITQATKHCNSTPKAAVIVTFLTILVGFINWGLALIFGAILARKVGEAASMNNIKINYPLVGAAGYVGLMVWHGGLSGSSLVKVVEKDHLKSLMAGIVPPESISKLPETITFSETVFSTMNIFASILLLLLVPLAMYWVAKKTKGRVPKLMSRKSKNEELAKTTPQGAEKLDHSKILAIGIGTLIIGLSVLESLKPSKQALGFITPNFINFCLLGLAIAFHKSFFSFLKGIDAAIQGASGILIQFPLYFGIMGIMNSSGLVNLMSAFFVNISSELTYPIFTFISAGIVNIFVPSGGGQWGVQGPIIIKSATEIGVPLSKSIMALAYGDQLTNMLQPFWALPLLGITGLKAKEILPYTLFLFFIGGGIFTLALLIF